MTDSTEKLMDVELHDAEAAFNFFAMRLRPLMVVGEKVKSLHALLGQERETRGLLADLQKQADALSQVVAQGAAAQQRLDDLNAAVAKVDERLNAMLTAGRAQADEITAAARKDAEGLAAEARLAADQLLVEARDQIAREIRANEDKLSAQEAEIAARQAVLDGINQHIAEARAKILAA